MHHKKNLDIENLVLYYMEVVMSSEKLPRVFIDDRVETRHNMMML